VAKPVAGYTLGVGKNQVRLQRMALESQIMEQAPEIEEVLLARAIGQRRMLLAEVTEPAEQVGIAGQLGEVQDLRDTRRRLR